MQEVKENSPDIFSSPPHIKSGDSIKKIMWTVIAVLLLPLAYSVYIFGIEAASVAGVSVLSAVTSEAIFQLVMRRKLNFLDGSSVITGLLLGLSVPPHIPLWIPAAGAVFAVVVVKESFGGLGSNKLNPALSGRLFIMILFPSQMNSSWHRFSNGTLFAEKLTTDSGLPFDLFNALTQATPLTAMRDGIRIANELKIPFDNLNDFFIKNNLLKSLITGNVGGSVGETSAFLILLCGLFLIWRKIISWQVPVTFIGTMAFASYLFYYLSGFTTPGFLTLIHVFSGGLFLGAFFMATDMVTTPLSSRGLILFGIGCGAITFLIRIIAGYPEGVLFGILIMNAAVSLIDRITKPGIFGE